MKIKKCFLYLVLILNISVNCANSADINVSDAFKECAEQINEHLTNCTNFKICNWTIAAVSSVLTCAPPSDTILEKIATYCEYGANTAWIYLAGRALAKNIFKSISIDDAMRSKFQRVLSHDITAFVITIPSALSFAQLATWTDMPIWLEYLVSVPPFVIGGLQFLFDGFKGIRGFCRNLFGWCRPSPRETEERKNKFREILDSRKLEILQQERELENDSLQKFLDLHKKELKPDSLSMIFKEISPKALKALVTRTLNKCERDLQESQQNTLYKQEVKDQFKILIQSQKEKCEQIIQDIANEGYTSLLKRLLANAIYEYNGVQLQEAEDEVSSSSS